MMRVLDAVESANEYYVSSALIADHIRSHNSLSHLDEPQVLSEALRSSQTTALLLGSTRHFSC